MRFPERMKLVSALFFLLTAQVLFGQNSRTLVLTNPSYRTIKKHPQTKFRDSSEVIAYVDNLRFSAIKKGYLLASIDSIRFHGDTIFVGPYLGPVFGQAELSISPEDLEFLRPYLHVSEKFFTGIPFRPAEISQVLRRIHRSLENNGYPFASVHLDEIDVRGHELSARLNIEHYKEYRWSDIHIRGDSSIFSGYISGIIRIREGDLFNQSELDLISQRIAQINFIREIRPYEILFTQTGCELYLYLESNPVSSANGIVGLQQNAATGKVSLTGDVALKLLNVLHRGELLNFNWRSIRDQTQSLDARLNFPFLFKTPFGVDGTFKLYKRDSSFLELNSSIGIQYFLKGGNYLKVFYSAQSSNVLAGGSSNPSFSNLQSVSSNNYGISIFRQRIDYVPNPSKGFISLFTGSVGTRSSRSADSNQVIRNTVFRVQTDLNWYVPVARRHVIRLGNHSESYFAPQIYENEVSRFGGLQSQRGFNEEELYATTYSTFSLEYRFLVDRNSRAFVFFDQTFYENVSTAYYNDHPYGFGGGFAFGTGFGIFTISYALGKQMNNPILLRNGKVHFGYVAYF